MTSRSTGTLDGDGGRSAPKDPFSIIRAAAAFVLEDAPPGGVFTGPPPSPEAEINVVAERSPTFEPPPPVVEQPGPRRPEQPTPMAHRMMVLALVPFLAIAIGGLVMITTSSDRQPARPSRVVAEAVPTTATPSSSPGPAAAPPASAGTTVAPSVATPVAPVYRAPRATATTGVTSTVPVTATSAPEDTTTTTATTVEQTPTTEAPATEPSPEPSSPPTTEPAPTTTTTGAPPSLEPVE